jgi:hypothetical protein
MNRLFVCFPRRMHRRLALAAALLTLLLLLINAFGNSIEDDEEWYKHPHAYFAEVSCEHDEFTQRLFEELTKKMSDTLEKLEIKYFLCYGSLWGALKLKKTLPWDRNIDMCIIYNQLAALDEQHIHQAFKQNGLNYRYNSRRGKYVVTYKTVSGEITVFEKVGSHMERVGWEKRLFPHLYINYQNFPYQLIDKELPKIEFNGILVPAPHETFEIQKVRSLQKNIIMNFNIIYII